MRPVGAVAGRAAAIPAVVMELVADVRHGQLVDDARVRVRARRRVDDGEIVGRLDARTLVEAGDVEELLGWGVERLVGRCEKRGWRLGLVVRQERLPPSVLGDSRRAARTRRKCTTDQRFSGARERFQPPAEKCW